jgi:GTP:adenosylcobinamide-phosphate guanylyltransferase
MDVKSVISLLETGVSFVHDLTPIVGAFGGPVAVAAADATVAIGEIANNILVRVEEGKAVATSEDVAKIKAIIDTLQKQNDKLAAQISGS